MKMGRGDKKGTLLKPKKYSKIGAVWSMLLQELKVCIWLSLVLSIVIMMSAENSQELKLQ